jgi:hypothetical protein
MSVTKPPLSGTYTSVPFTSPETAAYSDLILWAKSDLGEAFIKQLFGDVSKDGKAHEDSDLDSLKNHDGFDSDIQDEIEESSSSDGNNDDGDIGKRPLLPQWDTMDKEAPDGLRKTRSSLARQPNMLKTFSLRSIVVAFKLSIRRKEDLDDWLQAVAACPEWVKRDIWDTIEDEALDRLARGLWIGHASLQYNLEPKA